MTSLCDEIRPMTKSPVQVSSLIVKVLSRILKLQSLVVSKECKLNILKRGIEKNVILKRNLNVQCIVTDLLDNQFCDRDEILRFQHFMYINIMNIEAKSIEGEITSLNCIASKERRLLKSITDDNVFKLCNVFLQGRKASEMISFGYDNEASWKKAMLSKDEQVKSIDNWLKMVKVIAVDRQCGDEIISEEFTALSSLSVSSTVIDSIEPNALADDVFFNDTTLRTIDDDVDKSIRESSSTGFISVPVPEIAKDEDVIVIPLTIQGHILSSNDEAVLDEVTGLFGRCDEPPSVSDSSCSPKGSRRFVSLVNELHPDVRENSLSLNDEVRLNEVTGLFDRCDRNPSASILQSTLECKREIVGLPNVVNLTNVVSEVDVSFTDRKRSREVSANKENFKRKVFSDGKFDRAGVVHERNVFKDVRNERNGTRGRRDKRNRNSGNSGYVYRSRGYGDDTRFNRNYS